MRGRDKLKKYKKILDFLIFLTSLINKKFANFLYHRITNFGGNFGILLRYLLLKRIALHCGDNVSIHKNCFVFNIGNLYLGDNISIHPMCYIDGFGGIRIGNNTSIAHGVTIMSSTHTYEDKSKFIKDQPVEKLPTTIGNDVWIGAKAMVMGGINISDRVVVGACSVVTNNIESNKIVVGNPSRIIKNF